jgi:hypothetical protein
MSTQNNPSPPLPAQLFRLINGGLISQAIHVVAELGIADMLKDGPRSVSELAEAAGANPRNLYRVLRALASIGVFAETEDKHFELTPLAEYLKSDAPESQRGAAMMFGGDWYWKSVGQLLHTVKTGETSLDSVYNMTAYEFFDQDEEAGRLFHQVHNAGMTEAGIEAVLDAYDFTGINTLIDVGGSYGSALASVLKRYENMNGIVFDLPYLMDDAKAYLTEQGIIDRCQVVGGDFFEAVPSGGDAYMLLFVVTDWEDDKAVEILKNCRKAMTKDGKVLIVAGIIKPGNVQPPPKMYDLLLMILTGGLNRTLAEFENMLTAAGFKLGKVTPTARALFSVIEGIPIC